MHNYTFTFLYKIEMDESVCKWSIRQSLIVYSYSGIFRRK
jgi:hypothetical protein